MAIKSITPELTDEQQKKINQRRIEFEAERAKRIRDWNNDPLRIHLERARKFQFIEYLTDQGISEDLAQRVRNGSTRDCSVGRGWIPLVNELNERIRELDPNYRVDQCKEKFGGLRFYVSYDDITDENRETANKLIEEAEDRSFEICEDCGKLGSLSGKRWIRTLCEEHGKMD